MKCPHCTEIFSPERRTLPDERRSLTHKFSVGGHEGHVTAGLYEDGQPGDIFIVMAKQGSTISGLMDSFATAISLALQYGVPLQVLVDKFSNSRFEPSGFTTNPEIPMAKSVMDYIFRWLSLKFLLASTESATKVAEAALERDPTQLGFLAQMDSPACSDCGAIMVRSGNCYRCLNCGSTSGCS